MGWGGGVTAGNHIMVDGSLKGQALVDVAREQEVMRALVLLFLGDFVCDVPGSGSGSGSGRVVALCS